MDNKINFSEIIKLEDLLSDAEIPHTFTSLFGGYQIRLFDKQGKELDDCVLHIYSHGSEKGLLETYSLGDCEGYQTAEQIFEGWKTMYKN